jgi:hypothetical protein
LKKFMDEAAILQAAATLAAANYMADRAAEPAAIQRTGVGRQTPTAYLTFTLRQMHEAGLITEDHVPERMEKLSS